MSLSGYGFKGKKGSGPGKFGGQTRGLAKAKVGNWMRKGHLDWMYGRCALITGPVSRSGLCWDM